MKIRVQLKAGMRADVAEVSALVGFPVPGRHSTPLHWCKQVGANTMSSLDDGDVELCIPVSALYDEFVCPICLSPVTDAYITPCGHNACNGCLQEWISRKHTCPVCVAPDITVPRLVKNIGFDNLYLKVCEERTKASAKYFKGLTAGAPAGGAVGAPSSPLLSPIEVVFQKHMQASLSGFTSLLHELESKFNRRREAIAAQYCERIDSIRAAHRVALKLQAGRSEQLDEPGAVPAPPALVKSASVEDSERVIAEATAWRDEQLGEIQRQHDTAVQAVVAEYDAYMGSAMPSPSLLPAVVTVTVPSKGWRFQLKLRPTDYLRDVIECVGEKVAQGFGEQIQSFAPDCRWSIADAASVGAGAGTSNTIFFTDDTPLYTQCPGNRVLSGSDIVCVGTVVLKSDAPGVCFAKEFIAGANQSQDYFTCESCNCNWICATCAKHCHKAHKVKPYLVAHRPSYGCCYCTKKKMCTLTGEKK